MNEAKPDRCNAWCVARHAITGREVPLVCVRPKGHPGDHESEAITGGTVIRWPNELGVKR